MICPKCGAEYRRGFTSCSDCHVLLVERGTEAAEKQRAAWSTWSTPGSDPPDDREEELSEGGRELEGLGEGEESSRGSVGDPTTDPFCSFWRGADLRICTEVCGVLDEAGIPHRTIRREDHLFNFNRQVPYEVGVPASLYEKAEHAIRDAFGTADESAEQVKLLPPPQEDPRAKTLRSVWVGDQGDECAGLCRELQTADIPYRVDEQKEIAPNGKTLDRYQIGVPEEDYDRAVEITGGFHPEALEEPEEEEQSTDDEIPAATNESKPGSEWVENRAVRGEFYPEDATCLVWEGQPESLGEAIEMSLKEGDIPIRWETENGKESVFVLPADETRAKEIVREVITGQPSGAEQSQESAENPHA